MPITVPLLLPTVATDVALLLQVPPPVASLSVMVCPTHTLDGPEIAAGNGTTLMVMVV